MIEYYTTKQAADLTGSSRQSIRVYSNVYKRFFSSEGAPPPGQSRKFTQDDIKLIAYIAATTELGLLHSQVIERLNAGALDEFTWQPPQAPQAEPQQAEQATGAYLVPVERLQATQALMADAQRREQQALDQAAALQAEVQRLTLELGQATGELQAYKSLRKRPRWLIALLGGE